MPSGRIRMHTRPGTFAKAGLVIAATVAAGALAGCSGSQGESASAAEPSDSPSSSEQSSTKQAKNSSKHPTITDPAEAKKYTKKVMKDKYGWDPGQFKFVEALWDRESSWDYSASGSGGAYGIPQAMPASKMASAGSDYETNAATQIDWGLKYIHDRYGSPAAAWAHSQQTGAY